MTPDELAREKYNFREVSEQQTCANCDNAKGDIQLGEGYDRCAVHQRVLYWPTKKKQVCDAWKKKYVPTARDKALAKLNAEDKRVLGL